MLNRRELNQVLNRCSSTDIHVVGEALQTVLQVLCYTLPLHHTIFLHQILTHRWMAPPWQHVHELISYTAKKSQIGMFLPAILRCLPRLAHAVAVQGVGIYGWGCRIHGLCVLLGCGFFCSAQCIVMLHACYILRCVLIHRTQDWLDSQRMCHL